MLTISPSPRIEAEQRENEIGDRLLVIGSDTYIAVRRSRGYWIGHIHRCPKEQRLLDRTHISLSEGAEVIPAMTSYLRGPVTWGH
jgi:hypothetical protein